MSNKTTTKNQGNNSLAKNLEIAEAELAAFLAAKKAFNQSLADGLGNETGNLVRKKFLMAWRGAEEILNDRIRHLRRMLDERQA